MSYSPFHISSKVVIASRRGKVHQAEVIAGIKRRAVTEVGIQEVLAEQKKWDARKFCELDCLDALGLWADVFEDKFYELVKMGGRSTAKRRVAVLLNLAGMVRRYGFWKAMQPRNDFSVKFEDYRFMTWASLAEMNEKLGFYVRRHIKWFREQGLITGYQSSNHTKDDILFYAFNWSKIAEFLGFDLLVVNRCKDKELASFGEAVHSALPESSREFKYPEIFKYIKYCLTSSKGYLREVQYMKWNTKQQASRLDYQSANVLISATSWNTGSEQGCGRERLFRSVFPDFKPTGARLKYFMAAAVKLHRELGLPFRRVFRSLKELWRDYVDKFSNRSHAFHRLLETRTLEHYVKREIIDYEGSYMDRAAYEKWAAERKVLEVVKEAAVEEVASVVKDKCLKKCAGLPDDIQGHLDTDEDVLLAASWLGKCTFGEGVIFAPNNFMMDYIENNVLSKLGLCDLYSVQLDPL